MRAGRAALLALALAWPGLAQAAAGVGDKNVDVYQGPVLSTARIMGLGGAYAGVAEGQDGQPFNVASLANRDRHADSGWDFDLVVSFVTPGLGSVQLQDFDGDGKPDEQLRSRNLTEVGLAFQAGRFGVGFLLQRLTFDALSPSGNYHLQATTNDLSLGAAYSVWREQIILGGEVVLGGATFSAPNPSGATAASDYSKPKFRVGLLVRPREQNFRLGVQFEPGVVARESASYGLPFGEGLERPAGVSLPWLTRIGASFWLGPNATFYNAPSPEARREEVLEAHLAKQPEPSYPEPRPTALQPILITLEADVVGPSADGVTLVDYVSQGSIGAPRQAGGGVTVSPHAGAEWEILHRWLRLRGGGYLEPSRYSGNARGHGCFGLDLRIPLGVTDLKVGFGGDLARDYINLAFTVGTWRETGPHFTAAK